MKKMILPFVLLLSMTAICQNPLLLKDIYPGITGSGIQQIVKTTNYTFFNAEDDDPDADRGLYRTDGTPGGTIKLNLSYLPDPSPSPNNYLSTKADSYSHLLFFDFSLKSILVFIHSFSLSVKYSLLGRVIIIFT